MKLEKKHYTVIFIIAFVIIIGVGAYFIFFNDKVEDPNKNNEPVPPGSPTPKWVPETFPLNIGMYGLKIKALQKALGLTGSDVDGKLGTIKTLPALIAKGYNVPLSQTDYDKIVNPVATGGGTNYANLKKALAAGAKDFSGGIYYLMSGKNKVYRFDFYTNGRFVWSENGAANYLKKGSYSDGGKKMSIDGGDSYEQGSPQQNMFAIVDELGQ